jgi:threonine synthase
MARTLGYFAERKGAKATILVATSGDTGSAVAHGFYRVPNIDVIILYPSGKVSEVQEKQLTTLGENVQALEIDGTFDDCQHLVKQAFLDQELKESLHLTSANSINMARLLPQSIYYFWAYAQLYSPRYLFVSVPSGNYGNLTAGLIAKRMGLPVTKFVAASNLNDIVPKYLFTGDFQPKPSIQTYSNAMDVGNPSNFSRILDLYDEDWQKICTDIDGFTLDDEQTLETMKACFHEHGYLLDPHGAIGYAGLKVWLPEDMPGVFLETAHPAKFGDVMEKAELKYDLPERLRENLDKDKQAVKLGKGFEEFTTFLKDWAG